jgi:N-acyl-D-aspartate/D-glutamate deacylase
VLDVAIRGGTVIDGTGAPAFRADVGIRDGRVASLGRVDEAATLEIDAGGRVVTPGVVDIHTHYDAQVFWDDTLGPSPLHGVTTVVGGNCGFSIAPLAPSEADYLMRMLARVEGMPLRSLREGVPWDWSTTAEYLDRLEGRLSVNAGFMVGHSAIRRVVMGERGTGEAATDEEIQAMCRLLAEGLAAGGLGFSSSQGEAHNDGDGNPIPSRHASTEELLALCRVTGQAPGTSLEFIPPLEGFADSTVDLMARMSFEANRPLNWNALGVSAAMRREATAKLAASDYAAAHGGRVVALTIPMANKFWLSFATGFIFDSLPGWASTMALPAAERVRALSSPAERARLEAGARQARTLKDFADWGTFTVDDACTPETKRYVGRRIADIAAEEGKSPFDALLDIVVQDGLQTVVSTPPRADTDEDWQTRVDFWRDERVVIGASDAGAHLDLVAQFQYPTEMLANPVRRRGLLTIEEAVHLITDVPARLYGLRHRGRVAEGWHADLVVLDPDTVGPGPVYNRSDVPGGASRVYAEAVGIDQVLVNGQPVVTAGKFTDARPGAIVRSGRDTETVTAH